MLDTVIIGSGPAGMSAAIYAKRANLQAVVLEKIFMGTGQVAESSEVDNYLGLPSMNGYEMGETFRNHAVKMQVDFKEGEAIGFEQTDSGWKVLLAGGEVIETKTVIYAAGASHRHLGVPGEEEFGGKGVSYCAVCDGAFYRKKTVAVLGGGNTALDDALYLSELCEKVYLIHRRNEFRGAQSTVELLKAKENVEIITGINVDKIEGENRVQSLTLSDGRKIDLNGVFVAVGMEPQTTILMDIVELDESGYVKADETGKTSADGFYVAGDVRTKKLRQVITAASDGANAAVSAADYIRGI